MTTSPLNLNQSPEELANVHRTNYYHYLESEEHIERYFKPLASLVDSLGGSVLDVACGRGILGRLCKASYTGLEGSEVAVSRAREDLRERKDALILHGRFEDPPELPLVDVVVFSGVLHVLVKEEARLDFIRMYLARTGAENFIVGDLAIWQPGEINEVFLPLEERQISLNHEEEVKRCRILVAYGRRS